MLLARGPLLFEGTDDGPIILEGMNGKLWQGIVVMKASHPSEWSHVKIRNTSGINSQNWSLTGGVSFYRSDINMANCTFEGSQAEDALNIIHSEFQLKNVEILNTISDGFDSDFSKGHVDGGMFRNIGSAGGGDAIDVSAVT